MEAPPDIAPAWSSELPITDELGVAFTDESANLAIIMILRGVAESKGRQAGW